MSNFQTIEKMNKSIGKLPDIDLVGYQVGICHRCILSARTEKAKTRLVNTAIMLAHEEMRRAYNPDFDENDEEE